MASGLFLFLQIWTAGLPPPCGEGTGVGVPRARSMGLPPGPRSLPTRGREDGWHCACGSPPSQPPPQGGRCFDRVACEPSAQQTRSASPPCGGASYSALTTNLGLRSDGFGALCSWAGVSKQVSLPLVGREQGWGCRGSEHRATPTLHPSPQGGGRMAGVAHVATPSLALPTRGRVGVFG